MRKTTDELLKHYAAGREPKKFFQIDGWYSLKGDGVVTTDENGHAMTGSVTFELMHGADVRILIDPSTPPSEAAALLRKAANWLDRDTTLFQDLPEPEGGLVSGAFVVLNRT